MIARLLRLLAAVSPGPPETDEVLFARYIDGDAAAFGELFDRYGPALTRLMRRRVRKQEDARDLVQQTFLQLHRARRDFRQGALLRPWLYTIALNLRREYFRRLARRKETPMELADHNVPTVQQASITKRQAGLRLRQAVDALPEGQRIVIQLHWFEGLSFPEVSQVIGVKLSAVKVRAHRAYKVLRQAMEAQGLQPEAAAARGGSSTNAEANASSNRSATGGV